jgi:hypothetical protein
MARPRKQTYVMSQYMDNVKEGYISNDADTQRNPAWKPIINGLIVTVLTDDYIPPIILTEDNNGMLHIVDGGSRTAALRRFRYMNHKISSKTEDTLIRYKEKTVDEDGEIVWKDAEFDIKNKTYDKLPKELKKKFDEYQLETVIHENCTFIDNSKYIKRYNMHSGMNVEEKALTYIPNFAKKIRNIADRKFFNDYSDFTDSQKEKGKLERVVFETVMCMFHFDNWKTQANMMAGYLNDNSNKEEFKKLESNICRLENVITNDIKNIFNIKDSFIFLTLFDRFTNSCLDDNKFVDFLREFQTNYRINKKNEKGLLFDEIDKEGSTKDKVVVTAKLDMLTNLMYEYLHITPKTKEDIYIDDFCNTDLILSSDLSDEDKKNVAIESLKLTNNVADDALLYADSVNEWLLNIEDSDKLIAKNVIPAMIGLVNYIYNGDYTDEQGINTLKNYLHTKSITNSANINLTNMIACVG